MVDDRRCSPLHALLPKPAGQLFLDCVASVVDQFTFARLTQAGVPVGSRCLVIGPSGGSAARWLTTAVGPSGEVVTLDQSGPATNATFDLIYSRLALAHLSNPSEVLTTLAAQLVPGGVFVVDEWLWSARVLAASHPDTSASYARFQHALATSLAARGHDLTWAERVPAAMLSAGLVGVDVAAHARSWSAGTGATTMDLILATELGDWLLAAGLGAEVVDLLRVHLADPDLLLLGNLMISTIGRRDRVGDASFSSEPSDRS